MSGNVRIAVEIVEEAGESGRGYQDQSHHIGECEYGREFAENDDGGSLCEFPRRMYGRR